MMLRTKGEQKAYLDGYEMCAECIENYLTDEGKQKLECLLVAVRNAVGIEDLEPQASEKEKAKEITPDFAIEYILDGCGDCPENKDGECMTQSHCFEVKQMAIKALRMMDKAESEDKE